VNSANGEFRPIVCDSCNRIGVLFQSLISHLVCPSPSGWYLEVKWSFSCPMCSEGPEEVDTNSMPRSEGHGLECHGLEKHGERIVGQVGGLMVS